MLSIFIQLITMCIEKAYLLPQTCLRVARAMVPQPGLAHTVEPPTVNTYFITSAR